MWPILVTLRDRKCEYYELPLPLSLPRFWLICCPERTLHSFFKNRCLLQSWFCWADSLFAELVMSLTDQCPSTEHKYRVMEWRDLVLVPGGIYAED